MATCAKWLLENKLQAGSVANPKLRVIAQSGSAARQLRSNLLHFAIERGDGLTVPVIETPYQFALSCIQSTVSVADELIVKLLIADTLQQLSEQDVSKIFGHQLTKDWNSYAEQLYASLRFCTWAGVQFDPASWNAEASSLVTADAIDRLNLIDSVIEHVSTELNARGYKLEHHAIQEALLVQNDEIEDLVLVGTTDLQPMFVQALQNYVESLNSLDVLTRAPKECEMGFNAFGVIDAEYWQERKIDIPEECIHVAGAPSHQSASLLRAINNEEGIPIDQLVVSVTDEANAIVIKQQIEDYGIQTRMASGQDVTRTLPFLLLQTCIQWLSTRSVDAFASLVRHPDIIDVLGIHEVDIASFDEWRMEYLPEFLKASALRVLKKDEKRYERAAHLYGTVYELFNEYKLYQSLDTTRQNVQNIRDFLLRLFGEVNLRSEAPLLEVFRTMFNTLELLEEADELFMGNSQSLSPVELIQYTVDQLRKLSLPEYPNEHAVEIVGWLEAMNVDDPFLFVVGMNSESIHDERITPFFPNQVKHALGVDSIELRLARDAHAIEAMCSSRTEEGAIHFIVARKGLDGDPLTPSSLLLKSADTTQLAKRALSLTTAGDGEAPSLPKSLIELKEGEGIPLPRPNDYSFEQPTKVSVTAFKDYLSCPYRYWLKHVLKLKTSEDALPELDHKDFGILFHLILQEFSDSDERTLWKDPSEIESYLVDKLDHQLLMRFGTPKHQSGLIQFQREVAIARFALFSQQQSTAVREGWRMLASEVNARFSETVDGKPIAVHGKIDRIEQHHDGRLRVLDYKTGSAKPAQTHIKHKQWVDLQLPLYRRLLQHIEEIKGEVSECTNIELGYFNIASNASNSGIHLLKISDALEAEIEPTILHCLRGIVNCNFGDAPTAVAPKYSEEFSWICQDSNVFGDGGQSEYE